MLEATGERLALRGRAVPAASLGLPSLAPDAVARSRRRMALARAGAPVAAGWREATLVAAARRRALDDGADVLALAEEAATAGCPAVVRAALGQDAPAGDALAPALVELLDEALALALGVAWARAGVHDPGVVALAERRAAEARGG